MIRAFMAASVVALLPACAFAYINAGFRSEAEYQRHLRQERAAKIGRATEAIQRNPRDPVAYFYRANIYASGGGPNGGGGPNREEALADFTKAIELDPKFAAAYLRRGQVRLSMHRRLEMPKEDETAALADLEKATQFDPKCVEAYVYFAVHTKDVAKSIRAMKLACEHTDYKGEVCLQLLAHFYAKDGDFDNAVRWQEKALKADVFQMDLAKERLEKYRNKKATTLPYDWELARYEAQRAKERR
jgi:tetratricopeptide (TPR) repeat protein